MLMVLISRAISPAAFLGFVCLVSGRMRAALCVLQLWHQPDLRGVGRSSRGRSHRAEGCVHRQAVCQELVRGWRMGGRAVIDSLLSLYPGPAF